MDAHEQFPSRDVSDDPSAAVIADLMEHTDFLEAVPHIAPHLLPAPLSTNERLVSAIHGSIAGFLAAWVVGSVIWQDGVWPDGLASVLFLSCVLGGIAIVGGIDEVLYGRRVRASLAQLARDPVKVYAAVAARFRSDIKEQRDRLLGSQSDWQRAREPLLQAADEANRSVTYWTLRAKEDPSQSTVATQLSTAQRLQLKFRDALAELDRRSETLLAFFNECEARILILDRHSRDYEESRRLMLLSDRADIVVEDASEALRQVGRLFVGQVAAVRQALGGLERLQLKELAGVVALDDMETVADQILESADRERAVLQRLAGQLR